MRAVPLGATADACRICGKSIMWVYIPTNNTAVPLDPVAPTYQLEILRDSGDEDAHRWVRANTEGMSEPAFVSHFATCPQALRRST